VKFSFLGGSKSLAWWTWGRPKSHGKLAEGFCPFICQKKQKETIHW